MLVGLPALLVQFFKPPLPPRFYRLCGTLLRHCLQLPNHR
jgi:hypothetical protein